MRPAAVVLLGALALVLAALPGFAEEKGQRESLPRIGPAPEFSLTSQDGGELKLADLRGKVVAVTFIFTRCIDTCPVLTPMMSFVQDRLGSDFGARIVFVSITVDPERDTPEVLRDYVSGFGRNFVGLTGEPVAIRKIAKTFKVFFQKKPLPDGVYTMDHSAVIYILDPQARARLMFTAKRQPNDVAHDILQLLHQTS